MEVPEDSGANGSSNQEPRERFKLRLCAPDLPRHPHRPLMGSITVNTFNPLLGTLGGGVMTGSIWPEEDATTTADEVDGGYGGGLGKKSESGAPYPKS